MSNKKKAAQKLPVIDPYLPHNGNFGYRVSRYELDLEYKVAINRLAGSATITAVTLAELQTFTLDLALSVLESAPADVPGRGLIAGEDVVVGLPDMVGDAGGGCIVGSLSRR